MQGLDAVGSLPGRPPLYVLKRKFQRGQASSTDLARRRPNVWRGPSSSARRRPATLRAETFASVCTQVIRCEADAMFLRYSASSESAAPAAPMPLPPSGAGLSAAGYQGSGSGSRQFDRAAAKFAAQLTAVDRVTTQAVRRVIQPSSVRAASCEGQMEGVT